MGKKFKKSIVFKGAAIFLAFVLAMPGYLYAAQNNYKSQITDYKLANDNLLLPSAPYDPPVLRGIKFDPADPLKFDFIVYEGQNHLGKAAFKEESAKLIRYFLAGLTIPEEDLWVNLSPYEHDKIAPQEFSQTDIGKEMLSQDYLLKQLAASLTYPETEQGKKYWDAISNVGANNHSPVHQNFNKIWIMPQEVAIFQDKDRAFVKDIKFKVMTEEDYLAMQKNSERPLTPSLAKRGDRALALVKRGPAVAGESSGVDPFKTHILPLIEKEVNHGKNFVSLRQLTYSIMLAVWFKGKLKESIINKIYSDKKKIKGIETSDPSIKEKIYQQYLEAFQKGAYNYVKSERVGANGRSPVQKISKRRYFSGGVVDGAIDGVPASEYIADTAQPLSSASTLERGEIAADTEVVTVRLRGADALPAPAPAALPIVENGFLYRDRLNTLLNQVAAQIVDRHGRPIIEKVFVTGSVLSLDKDGKVPLAAIGDIDIVVIENQGFVAEGDAQKVRLKWYVLAKKLKDNGFAQEVTPTLLKITEEVNWYTLPRLHDVLKYSTRAFPLVERSVSNPSRRKAGKRFDIALKNALGGQKANAVLAGKTITTKVFSSVDIYKKSFFGWLDDRLASSGEILTLEEQSMLRDDTLAARDLKRLKRFGETKLLIDGDTSARDELLSILAAGNDREARLKQLKAKFMRDFYAAGGQKRLKKLRDENEGAIRARIDRIVNGGPAAPAPAPAEKDLGGIDLAHAAKKIKSQGKGISLTSSAPQLSLDEKTFSGFTFTILATAKVTSPDILFR